MTTQREHVHNTNHIKLNFLSFGKLKCIFITISILNRVQPGSQFQHLVLSLIILFYALSIHLGDSILHISQEMGRIPKQGMATRTGERKDTTYAIVYFMIITAFLPVKAEGAVILTIYHLRSISNEFSFVSIK